MMRNSVVPVCSMLLLASSLSAQSTLPPVPEIQPAAPKISWFSRRDIKPLATAFMGVGLSVIGDEGAATRMQLPALHRSPFLGSSAGVFRRIGDPGVLVGSASLYVLSKVGGSAGLAQAARHSTEAIIVSGAITQLLKLSIGRARPSVTGDENEFAFRPLHGSQVGFNSFPSGHTTASFAAASVFSSELQRRHPNAARWVKPALYGVAGLVGASRMYNDRHWLSDVVAGAVIGDFTGRRVVDHAQ